LPRRDGGDAHDARELPTRLTAQFMRLACCLAAVLGRPVDAEVLRRVRKVAIDTGRGKTFDMAKLLRKAGEAGTVSTSGGLRAASADTLAAWVGCGPDRALTLLNFLRRNKVAQRVEVKGHKPRWRLTERFRALWERVEEIC
jgi:hypothetical protein